ncbi:MAG: SMP-30/gluconolactonase/LRE family protein [Lachnospiraceae bacterium]|nr:SMP-30/gluconolactonase/LRE family protein [Lachnospiraceae bacterium]
MTELELLDNNIRCIVAEGPIWNEITGELLYLDILGECIFIMSYKERITRKINVGQQIGCMAVCENGDLLLAMQDGIYRMDAQGNKVLAHQPIKIKGRRFNDGKVGPDGCFYVGTTDNNNEGAFYRLKDGVLTELFDGCGCSNGLDWTADETQMYYCDTVKQKIEVFDFDAASNRINNRKTFVNIPAEMGKPDGFCMDENNDIWLALWDGHSVLHIESTTGKVLSKLDVPAAKASCCCFAGEELSDLIITTASLRDEGQYPLSGYIFKTRVGVKGKKTYRYKY